MKRAVALTALVLSLVVPAAEALGPSEVFDKVSPSVWAVRGLDESERPVSYGSGVVVGPGRLVTNCHVIEQARIVHVRRENVIYVAKLEYADYSRDLCTLKIEGFEAPAVEIGMLADIKIGQRVYAVGNPERLALTLSEGIVSGLRSKDESEPLIQTTAPLSPGSSGGGLFDEAGRLIGITTLTVLGRQRIAQNLNFAVPAEWVERLLERETARRAKREAGGGKSLGSPASDSLPPVGAVWKYSFRERQYSGKHRQFTVRVMAVDEWNVTEALSVDGGSSNVGFVNAQKPAFISRSLAGNESLLEFSPYILAGLEGKPFSRLGQPQDYPLGGIANSWMIKDSARTDHVSVPAGSFGATRIEINGERTAHNLYYSARFRYTAWYSRDVGRYVKIQHEAWNGQGLKHVDEVVELLAYE